MRLRSQVTLNINNNKSMEAVFLDTEKAFDITWHPGLYKLHKIKVSTNFIKLVSFFLSERKFTVPARGEMSTPREIQADATQGSVLSSILYSMYINDNPPRTPGVYLALFADDTCMYIMDRKVSYVLRKLQRGLNSMET
jgi:hypothetical protein